VLLGAAGAWRNGGWLMAGVIVSLLALILASCSGPDLLDPAQAQEFTDARGAIVAVNEQNGWYGIVPDSDRGTRYAPDRLPDDVKKDGVRVIFSGRVGPIDPNVRMWGTPFTVTSIRAETP
jgi:hypothetical protein